MKVKVTYKTEFGGILSDIIECPCLDEARTTALDEIPGCCEIENIEDVDAANTLNDIVFPECHLGQELKQLPSQV